MVIFLNDNLPQKNGDYDSRQSAEYLGPLLCLSEVSGNMNANANIKSISSSFTFVWMKIWHVNILMFAFFKIYISEIF